MTDTPKEQTASEAPPLSAPGPDDPRFAFAKVTDEIGKLIEATTAADLGNPTPCPEFAVSDLLDHMVMVMRRVAAVGRGEHWSTVQQDELGSEHAAAYRTAAHEIMDAWTDPARLEAMIEVPWGTFPGAPVLMTYTAELATHGWDLAQATNRSLDIADELLGGAVFAIKMVPAEGRDEPDMPFTEVVDPGPDAPLLLQIAGWAGRQVI